ncbi:type II secretion system F family protein [Loktanella agnita]|uniref:type II secretion system F family protein n=1 Tax=Loktanella agnita TaxID=287097 RepID=UPI00398734A7
MEQAQLTFSYTARDSSGARRSGQIAGADLREATSALRAQGLFPITLEQASAAAPIQVRSRKTRGGDQLSAKELSDFLARLAKLSGRQIQSERALAIMGDGGDGPIARAALRVRDSLREGAPLSKALHDKAGIDDAVTLSLISGAEVSGEMSSALATSAEILQNKLAVRRRIMTGLMYPSILLFVALMSVGLIMIAIIPQFRPLVEDRMEMVPAMGRAVFAFSAMLTSLWPLLLTGLLAAGGATYIAAKRGVLMSGLLTIGNRIPFVRRLLLRNQVMLILHVLGALLSREITLSGALRVVSKSAPAGTLRAAMLEATQQVENGAALSSALSAQDLLPREAIEMIRIGEEAGDLGGMISRTSLDMREAADRDLERFLLLFQPALIVGVGLMIGVSLYALFSAIVSVNSISF